MLRVCLVSPLPPPYGGIAHWTSMMVSYASGRTDVKFEVVDTAPRWRSIHQDGVLRRAIGGAFQLLRDVAALLAILVKRETDVIHLTTPGSLAVLRDLTVLCIARFFRVPSVYHIRFGRIPEIAARGTFEWRWISRAVRLASVVVAIDRMTYERVSALKGYEHVRLIPNFVNIDSLPPVVQGGDPLKRAMFLGWVVKSKGVEDLLQAWAGIDVDQDWVLEFVGPYDDEYRRSLDVSGVCVKFLGELSHKDAMRRLAGCNLFILPSHTEGFPNVILEAMALGKAIIATDVGAIPEMLSEGSGVVVRVGDSRQLLDVLRSLIGDAGKRAELGLAAKRRAEEFYGIGPVFSGYFRLWKEVSRSRF